MRITVVTVCFNAAKCIEETILSVIKQTHQDVEYIIIDGGSTDGTVDVIRKYTSRIVYWVSEPDNGIYDAMNKGIEKATGDYINFMNAGDYFVNNKILADVVLNVQGRYTDVIFGNVVELFDGVFYEIKAQPFYENPSIKHSMGFNHQCCFVKTEMAKRFLFDLKYRLAADYNMIMTIFRHKGTFMHIDIPVACYDTNGISQQQRFQHQKEVLSIEHPDRPFFNYLEMRKFVIVNFIRKSLKSIMLIVVPGMSGIIERRRESRMKKIEQ